MQVPIDVNLDLDVHACEVDQDALPPVLHLPSVLKAAQLSEFPVHALPQLLRLAREGHHHRLEVIVVFHPEEYSCISHLAHLQVHHHFSVLYIPPEVHQFAALALHADNTHTLVDEGKNVITV